MPGRGGAQAPPFSFPQTRQGLLARLHCRDPMRPLRSFPMTVRPPRTLAPKDQPSPLAALEHEMFVERAGTLIRMTKLFETKLDRFNNLAENDPDRGALVAETARALWMLAVQREAMGLPGGETLLQAYDVPAAVKAASGIVTQKVRRGLRVPRR
ncbi:MAG: hypothetical protein H6878_02935 [Rhodobiaceae bacterium]|nr:hypothetical protein [Rhodobiaceae bacterium]